MLAGTERGIAATGDARRIIDAREAAFLARIKPSHPRTVLDLLTAILTGKR